MMRLLRVQRFGGTAAVILISFAVSIACMSFGCEPKEQDPAKRVLAAAVKALGGLEKTRSWTTRIERGLLTQERPGWGTLQAECTFYVKKPDKLKMDQDFSAFDHPFYYEYYYNGGEAWAVVNANTYESPRITQNLKDFLTDVDGLPYYFAECDTFFLAGEVPDDSLFAGSAIERVGCVHGSDTVMFDIDRQTHLPVRILKRGGATQIILDDYRTTGGKKTAYHRTMYENGAMASEYIWNEVIFDEAIPEDVFEQNRPEKENASG